MKITNRHNLPEVLRKFARNSKYSRGDSQISVTQLINSARIVALEYKHWDEIEQDVSETLFALLGTAVHHILETSVEDNVITEKRYFTFLNGWKISGQIDRQVVTPEGNIIEDWKVTSSWAVMSEKVDWENQLNAYAWLASSAGITVKQLKINAIIRDWSRQKVGIPGYPITAMHQIDIPLWNFAKQRAYLAERLSQHAIAVMEDPPLCTSEERWEKPASHALQKIGAKRASKIFATIEEAKLNLRNGMEIVSRPGVNIRCENFCRVRQFCDFGKTLGETNEEFDTKLD